MNIQFFISSIVSLNIDMYCVNVHIRIIHHKIFLLLIVRVAKSVFLEHNSYNSKGEINHTLKVCFSPLTVKGA